MSRRIKIAFVGVGSMGQCAHLRNYLTIPDCEVVAVAELREKTGRRVAERHGIPRVYTDYEQMLRPYPDHQDPATPHQDGAATPGSGDPASLN